MLKLFLVVFLFFMSCDVKNNDDVISSLKRPIVEVSVYNSKSWDDASTRITLRDSSGKFVTLYFTYDLSNNYIKGDTLK